MLLAMVNRSKDNGKGSRVALVRAMRALKGRVHFLLQEGRIAAPRNLDALPGLLDRFVIPMCYDEAGLSGRSWHPKVCLLRYRPVDSSMLKKGEPSFLWRLWLGSRNFTKDDSWDLALFLTSAGSRGSAIPGVRQVGERLAQAAHGAGATGMQSEWGSLLDELDRVTWEVPRGVTIKDISLQLEPANTRRLPDLPAFPEQVIATAPFVDVGTLERLANSTGAAHRALISTLPSLESVTKTNGGVLENYSALYALSPVSEDALDVEDGDSGEHHDGDPESRGLHAKFLWAQYKERNILYLGSPNLTRRGWCSNAEIYAHIETTRDSAIAVALVEGFEAFRQRCQRIELNTLKPASNATTVQDRLEKVRKEIAARMGLRQRRDASGTRVSAQEPPQLPTGVGLSVGRIGEPGTPWPDGAEYVQLPVAGLERESELLLLELACDGHSVRWLQSAAFDGGLSEDRDDAMVASYLSLSGLLDLFADELEPHGLPDVDRHPWDHPRTKKERQHEKARLLGFSVESVMTAWRRAGKSGPEVVQRASKILDLAKAQALANTQAETADPDDAMLRRQLESLSLSWGAVQSALGGSKK
ncbi:hypothetical protein [Burkholderia sp. BCC1638]|uniref:hypothetical protein n=1 Tax=Burkholderia sp. BCC1638 TaxID=2681391 RepID=UPI00158AC341|nr:hypothetical protein [Burkholderia sp. BCC1638]